jgi:hypothetical protein
MLWQMSQPQEHSNSPRVVTKCCCIKSKFIPQNWPCYINRNVCVNTSLWIFSLTNRGPPYMTPWGSPWGTLLQEPRWGTHPGEPPMGNPPWRSPSVEPPWGSPFGDHLCETTFRGRFWVRPWGNPLVDPSWGTNL